MRQLRSVLLWSAISLLIVLVAGTLVLLIHPVLFTGRYYEFTVRSLTFDDDGIASITCDDVITYDTAVKWQFAIDRLGTVLDDWERKPPSLLRWPRKERERVLSIFLASDEEQKSGRPDSPALRRRLLLKEGTYRLRPGERLVYYRRTEPDGTLVEYPIEVPLQP